MDWYINYIGGAPKSFTNNKKIKSDIHRTIDYIMKIFQVRVFEIKEINIESASKVLIDIIDDLPVAQASMRDGELIIRYSRFIEIKLKDPLKAIYRDIKLKQILD